MMIQTLCALFLWFQSGSGPYFTGQETTSFRYYCTSVGQTSRFDPCTFQLIPVDAYVSGSATGCSPQMPVIEGAAHDPKDQRNLYSVGLDPATLAPEGLDLNIFPEFPLSDQLALRPVLAYAADPTLTREGILGNNPPKQWRNHYGELVRSIGRLDGRGDGELGALVDPNGPVTGDRVALGAEIQTYFVNATGQQVNFYPDPVRDPVTQGVACQVPSNPSLWYSFEGNYRLRKTSGGFELDTPDGLVYTFEVYHRRLNRERETLSVHYRVIRIADRFLNKIEINYRYATYPSGPCDSKDCLLPAGATSYLRQSTAPFQSLAYRYDSRDRLIAIDMPRPRAENPQAPLTALSNTDLHATTFRYPDDPSGDLLAHGTAATGKAVSSTLLALDPLTGYQSSGAPREIPAMLRVEVGGHSRIWLDLSDPAIGILNSVVDLSDTPSDGLLRPAYYFIVVNTTQGARYVFRLQVERLNLLNDAQGPADVRYRYQLDPATSGPFGYPAGVSAATYPDLLIVEKIIGPPETPEGQEAPILQGGVRIYPAMKAGDVCLAKQVSGTTALFTVSESLLASLDPEALAVASGQVSAQTPIAVLREDNLVRIAEMTFPASAAGGSFTQKRLELAYDDRSLNHGEIKTVELFDRDQILSQTEYTYQTLRSVATSKNTAVMNFGPDQLDPCDFPNMSLAGNATLVHIGLDRLGVEEELDALRRKVQRFSTRPGQALDGPPLTTHYGGAYRYVLAGLPSDIVQPYPPPPIGSGQYPVCQAVQWGLDGRTFDYTWLIQPDGSAKVFDLRPEGLDVDPVFAAGDRGKRVFKTYTFDTGFANAFQQVAPALANLSGEPLPYFLFLPTYPGGVPVSHFFDQPDLFQPSGYPTPRAKDLFGSGFRALSKCYLAEIVSYEPVPRQGFALGDRWLPRETVGALHGRYMGGIAEIGDIHARTSALRALDDGSLVACSGTAPAQPLALAEAFLAGSLCSSPLLVTWTLGDDRREFSQFVPWAQGRRSDIGSGTQPFQDHQKLFRLLPAFSYQARQLDGFTWNAATDCLAVNPALFVQGTRYSNGGYLGSATIGPTLTAGATQMDVTGAPSGLQAGDVFLLDRQYYRLTSAPVSGNVTLAFTPDLRGALTPGVSIPFYRFHFGDHSDTRYRGYDAFGNNDYAESYIGSLGMVWSSRQESGLLPDFRATATRPDGVVSNDSTAAVNNDTTGWRFFGRVKTIATRTRQPFFLFTGGGLEDPGSSLSGDAGFAYQFTSQTDYHATYPWLPTEQRRFFLPHTAAIPTAHDEDDLTQYTYYLGTFDHAYFGKLATETSFRRGTPTDFSVSRLHYDGLGRTDWQANASFKAGQSPYAFRTAITRDGNSGLVVQETRHAGATSDPSLADAAIAINLRQGITYLGYDRLGREIQSYQTDANGAPRDAVTLTTYDSAMRRTQTTRFPGTSLAAITSGGHVVATSVNFLDGLERATLALRQNGDSAPVFGSLTLYDGAGRVARTLVETQLAIAQPATFNPPQALATYFPASGYSSTLYNARGEAWGLVAHAPQGSLDTIAQSTWDLWAQDPNQAAILTRYSFHLSEDDSLGGSGSLTWLRVKRQDHDVYGRLQEVRDLRVLVPATPNFDENHLPAFTPAQLDAGTMFAKAVYSYDFGDRVTGAITGKATTVQVRSFKYDTWGRLRFERHPEIDTPMRFHDFNRFDQPRQIAYAGGTRSAAFDYDAYGNLRDGDYLDSAMLSAFHEERSYSTGRFPGLLETVFASEGDQRAGWGTGYRYRYVPQNGRLSARDMIHNDPQFLAGRTSLITPDWALALTVSQEYDALGRMTRMTYPAGFAGNGKTDLTYTYSAATGQLSEIADQATASSMLDQFQYGPENRLLSYRFSLTGAGAAGHRVTRSLDSLNRIEGIGFGFSTQASAAADFELGYEFDRSGRIRAIQTRTATQFQDNRFGYDPLGQLTQARVSAFTPATASTPEIHDYSYGYTEFGGLNLYQHNGVPKSMTSSLINNRLGQYDGAPAGYWSTGELKSLRLQGVNTSLLYSAQGRLTRILRGGEQADYRYDAFGMRVWAKTDPAEGDDTARLYCYGPDQAILSEWVADSETERWDRSYLYADGALALTLESQPQTLEIRGRPEPVPEMPADYEPPPPLLPRTEGVTATLRWGQVPGQDHFDVQIAQKVANQPQIMRTLFGVKGTSIQTQLEKGSHYYRVRIAGTTDWSQWAAFTVQPGAGVSP